ncbi:hypothetical protein ACRALDRAFT_208194 [Sodiomyces alcalophilus JCM 7366]|uniref:uncharacterized protein n=1 Tax=Sodiomyces alcalophilus JCM 7366 TaxID=591952 RepID=UPI0039B4D9AE
MAAASPFVLIYTYWLTYSLIQHRHIVISTLIPLRGQSCFVSPDACLEFPSPPPLQHLLILPYNQRSAFRNVRVLAWEDMPYFVYLQPQDLQLATMGLFSKSKTNIKKNSDSPPGPPTPTGNRYTTSNSATQTQIQTWNPSGWAQQPGSCQAVGPSRHGYPQQPAHPVASSPLAVWAPPAGYQTGYRSQQSHPQPQPQPQQQQKQRYQQQPMVVNQYYFAPQPPQHLLQYSPPPVGASTTQLVNPASSSPDLNTAVQDWCTHEGWHPHATLLLTQSAACVDLIADCFNAVMTSIDRDQYKGHERDLFTYPYQTLPPVSSFSPPPPPPPRRLSSPLPPPPPPRPQTQAIQHHPLHQVDVRPARSRSRDREKRRHGDRKPKKYDTYPGVTDKGKEVGHVTSAVAGNYFSKVECYANSRLPADLPRLRLPVESWRLVCLAAQYAERVYDSAKGAEREAHVSADLLAGTKAMVIKSVPMDDKSALVFAIRGSASFMDWAVNLKTAPTTPQNFLDDEGNLCHAGFLSVARRMVRPVATRLRQLLTEDPSRAGHSLVITGHSAGGAVATLLYCHMLSSSPAADSDLRQLAGRFRRVHCVVFGTPPISLLPLTTPDRPEFRKSLFLSFLNQGDPVARADKAYIKSLLDLLATPAPRKKDKEDDKSRPAPIWRVPPCTLSSAGTIVVLRSGPPEIRGDKRTVGDRLKEGVVAQTTTDGALRGVIWGDPVCHVMRLYAGRVETLAVEAVTGRRGIRRRLFG